MTTIEIKRLHELRIMATTSWASLMTEEAVKELRALEHKVAVEFAKKHGLKLRE